MTHLELKAARKSLGFSVAELAAALGMNPTQVRRMEMAPELSTSRRVMPTTERLVQAYLEGYRPKS